VKKTKQSPSRKALSAAIALSLAHVTGAGVSVAQAQTTLSEVRVESTVVGTQAQPLSLLGSFFQGDWLSQPVSASTIDEDAIKNSGSSRLTDVLRLDSSVDPNYSPIGYYENFQIRGFPVDPVLGMRVNGVPIVGEAPISMDNKQRVEVLRGPAGALVGMGSSGGLINLLTKRPDNIREAGIRVEQRESLGLTADVGVADLNGQGWRLNASADRYRPYAKGADGEGAMVSLAMDQRLSGGDLLQVDLEIAHKSQITQPGSQLLGGTVLPPINPETVLGLSSWSKPVTFDSLFAMARLQRNLQSGWKMTATGSVHHVKTDDRSSFPWGSGYGDPTNAGGGGTTLADAYFASNGNYILWDYQSVNEQRTTTAVSLDAMRELVVWGAELQTRVGAQLLNHISSKPNYFYSYAGGDPLNPFYGNVYSGATTTASGSTGSDVFQRDVWQTNVYGAAQFRLGGGKLSGGLRFSSLREGYRADFYPNYYNTIPWGWTEMNRLIPTINYSKGDLFAAYRSDIEAGAVAPLSSTNNGQILSARRIDSFEVGAKRKYKSGLTSSLAGFHTQRPYNFRNDTTLSDPAGAYIQRGTESRTGLELSLSGALTKRLDAQVSATLMTSDTSGTGNALFEGKEALNTPKFRLNTFVNYRLPGVEGLSANANWLYTGKRPASRDNSVYAPDFHRLDLGLSYVQKTKAGATTYRLAIENVTDERYWRDVAEFLGDAYLTPGAPRVVKASATVSF
jgi:iron complex outermembrane receptor protein